MKKDVDLEWTIKELIERIKDWEGIKPTTAEKYRLRNLEKKSLYVKEELNKKLKDFDIKEPYIRLMLETGEIPSLDQVALKIREFKSLATVDAFVKPETSVAEWYF